MTREEFIKKLKELEWTEEQIEKHLKIYDEAAEDGLALPYFIPDMGMLYRD